MKKKNLVFIGAPGAGKGTVAKALCAMSHLTHISTGDLLRAEIRAGSRLGKIAEGLIGSGKLLPDELISEIVSDRLVQSDCDRGFILDGFPRTIAQTRMLETMLARIGRNLDCAVYFEISDDLVLKRLTARLICRQCGAIYNKITTPPKAEGICDQCGGELYQRADDSPETIKSRLAVFYRENDPILEFYRKAGLLLTIPGECKDRCLQILNTELNR